MRPGNPDTTHPKCDTMGVFDGATFSLRMVINR